MDLHTMIIVRRIVIKKCHKCHSKMSLFFSKIHSQNYGSKVPRKLLNSQINKWKMGESESKFRPEPYDIWYKIRSKGKQPRLIQSVMQAIVHLRETDGSNLCRIVEYLQAVVNRRNLDPRPRGLAVQVKKALTHGIENGLIKNRGGKFSLALNARDFAIFKSFRSYDPIFGFYRKKRVKKTGLMTKCQSETDQRMEFRKSSSTLATKLSQPSTYSSFISMVDNGCNNCTDL